METSTIVPVVLDAEVLEEQKKKEERIAKAKETRRKNNLEKKILTDALVRMAKQKIKMYDPDTKKLVYKSKAELLAGKILDDALSEEVPLKDRIEAFKTIRDTMGEKPTERVEAQIGLTLEDYIKKVQGENDY